MSTQNKDILKYSAGIAAAALVGFLGYKLLSKSCGGDEVLNKIIKSNKGFIDKNLDKLSELTRERANRRSEIISNVHYDLVLSFFEHQTEFEGYIKATFDLSKVTEDAFFNFEGKCIEFCTINGEPVPFDKEIFKDHMIHLPKDLLQTGTNIVEIRYTGLYRRDGIGLHRYEDPEDGEMYLYTLFESFSANKCFPCFDQPNIKATMSFSCFTPSKWLVITNELEENVCKSKVVFDKLLQKIGCSLDIYERQDQEKLVYKQFNKTAKISTYLFAFVVGPYIYKSNTLPGHEKYKKMRIFSRKSMMKYVNHEEFFKITMAGMDYYKDFFGREYPFSKYDQVYVPEFNCGAMENVGCVTYTENYLDREKVVPMTKRHQRAITILHELSHQWFGNLVTMKWWDDLWLNESFATFMSHISLNDAEGLEEYKLSWDVFAGYKDWGVRTDEYESTHPVAADVKDTEDAENIFDGISYSKGASIMKQLVFYISEDVFRKGIQNYFKKFAYQNTVLEDLISTLQEACDEANLNVDLFKWCDSWIKTSGFNIYNPSVKEAEDGTIEEFKITQTLSVNGQNELRKQNLQICFFNENFDMEEEIYDVTIDSEETTIVDKLKGVKMPKAFFINYMDWGYGRFLIDDRSLEAFNIGLSKIKDDLTRKMIYETITTMAVDGLLSAKYYFNTVIKHIKNEPNQTIVQDILLNRIPSLLRLYVPEEYYSAEANKIFDFLLNQMLSTQVDEEMIQIVLSAIISAATTSEHILFLKEWVVEGKPFYQVDDKKVYVDAQLTPEQKHAIFKMIYVSPELSNEENQNFVEEQLESDSNNKDLVARCRLACQAAAYDEKVKQSFMDELFAEKAKYSIWEARAIMSTLIPKSQKDIVMPLVDRFFKEIPTLFKTRLRDERDAIYAGLSPLKFASEDLKAKYEETINSLNEEDHKSCVMWLKMDLLKLNKILVGKELYSQSAAK